VKPVSAAVLLAAALGLHLGGLSAQTSAGPSVTSISYAAAKPVLESLRDDLLPADLKAMTPAVRESSWPAWVAAHDSAVRARLERGDEDSVVNFLLFGTTFTKLPRATERDLAELAGRAGGPPDGVVRRIDDFITAIQSPGANERLQFARQVVERQSKDLTTPAARASVRKYLNDALIRMSSEIAMLSSERRLNDPNVELPDRLTRFRDRGLSSDTSIFADFAIDQALEIVKSTGVLGPASVRRVAIVGPGLDFTDKHEGYDFYPQQTIQPFAVIDSLIRSGLAAPDQIGLTTFDLSARINHHLEAARERARAGGGYQVVLPRTLQLPWSKNLTSYWERWGDKIGTEAKAIAVPPAAGDVRVRAVQVRSGVVLSIVPQDLNIVLQRLEPLASDDRFDLIIATNVLAYYDVFEQSLAFANAAAMLRPGGLLLTNNALFELPAIPMAWIGDADVTHMTAPGVGDVIDRMFWYKRE
jgi:hypothetical protein